MSQDVEVLDSAIRHQQTMFDIEIRLFLGRIVEGPPNENPIVGT